MGGRGARFRARIGVVSIPKESLHRLKRCGIHTHSVVALNCCRCAGDVVVVACSELLFSAARLVVDVFRDVEREKLPCPTGCFPRALSLMLLDCSGIASSTRDDELITADRLALLRLVSSCLPSSSSSSSSPIANWPCSGTLPRCCDERAEVGLRTLSIEPLRAGLRMPEGCTSATPRSFRSCVKRSSSAMAPSTVKSRRAWKRLRLRTSTSTKRWLAVQHAEVSIQTRPSSGNKGGRARCPGGLEGEGPNKGQPDLVRQLSAHRALASRTSFSANRASTPPLCLGVRTRLILRQDVPSY